MDTVEYGMFVPAERIRHVQQELAASIGDFLSVRRSKYLDAIADLSIAQTYAFACSTRRTTVP